MSQFKLGHRQWRPWKATKLEVLNAIHKKEAATAHDLMELFGYSYQGARNKLWLLHRQKLVAPLFQRGTWGITELAADKLNHYKLI